MCCASPLAACQSSAHIFPIVRAVQRCRTAFSLTPCLLLPTRCRPGLGTLEQDAAEAMPQGRVHGSSWAMVMSVADTVPDVPDQTMPPLHDSLAHLATELAAPDAAPGGGEGEGAKGAADKGTIMMFGRIASRLLYALHSRSRALLTAGCRTAGRCF